MIQESSLIRDNFLVLEIVMSHKQTITKYTDLPAVTCENFIGSLGGILNLWVGLSFITIIEIAELAIKVVKKVLPSTENKVPSINET